MKKSENILVFYQNLPVYNPQFEYREPYLRTHTSMGLSENYGKFTRSGAESPDGRRFLCFENAPRFYALAADRIRKTMEENMET